MLILAIVVSYFPEKGRLEDNVSSIFNDVDRILIWENTPKGDKQKYRYIDSPKVEYCGDGVNSISHALNYAWKYALANGYDYLLTMDQDSVFVNFPHYLKLTVFNPNCPEGIWAPTVCIQRLEHMDSDTIGELELKEIDGGNTSGMLQSVSLITKNGGWNEAFVIDGVDAEYCYRAGKKGIKCYQVKNVYLDHRPGTPTEYRFKRYYAVLCNYSPKRYYSYYRSIALLYRMFPDRAYNYRFFCYKRVKLIVFFEENGIKKLYYILKGIIAGNCCRLPIIES